MSKKLSFFCCRTTESFTPETIAKEGRGGSEEAVWQVSRRLAKMGWEVDVFADTGWNFTKDFEGVSWKPFWDFNVKDPRDVLVVWRRAFIFESDGIKAKKSYFWLHEALPSIDLTPNTIKRAAKMFILSNWHRSLYSHISDDKFSIKNNGIDLKDIKKVKVERNYYRLIYTSAYNRGLETLLNLFSDIKKEFSKAELHIFYGWFSWDVTCGEDPLMKKKKEEIKKLIENLGVYDHGRVSQEQILQEYAKSSIMAYPTEFEEVSFISGMKAQALGCIPVTTTAGCLEETVQFGHKINSKRIYSDKNSQEKWVQEVIKLLKNPPSEKEREPMMNWARERFDWDKIAKEWHEELSCNL